MMYRVSMFLLIHLLILAIFILAYTAQADGIILPKKLKQETGTEAVQAPLPPSNEETAKSWCALTKESINLRAGPAVEMPLVTKLRARELVIIATNRCATMKGAVACSDPEGWGYVESVPRLDNNRGAFTTGWIKIGNVRRTECK